MSDILATKYRPKRLADIIGQKQATRILENSITNRDLHHAYIFAGNFGCGKTTSARVFAACMNDPGGVTLEPNLDSKVVQAIFEGKHIDVTELDAAACGKIEEIRDLRNSIQFAPIECRYRFVLLDEAHRLSGAAAEAALKMIEEPPPETIFILCTTEPQKLKQTIDSRCLTLRFSKVPWDLIFSHLKNIAKSEKLDVEDQALRVAARKSKGSVRNALQNLQMISTFAGGKKITRDMALNALAAVDDRYYFDLVDSILKPDAGDAMRVIVSLLEGGRDIGEVLDGLVGHLRNLLIISTCTSTEGLVFLADDEKKQLLHQKSNMPAGQTVRMITEMLNEIGKINREVAFNMNPQVMLEKFAVESIIIGSGLKKKA